MPKRQTASQGVNPGLALMMADAGEWDATRNEKDPNGELQCADGLYFSRLADIVVIATQKNYPLVTFLFPLICAADGSRDYAGQPAKVTHWLTSNDKGRTKADAYRGLSFDFQRLGKDTGGENFSMAQMGPNIEALKGERPCVLLSITASKDGGKFVNIRNTVDPAEIERLIGCPLDDALYVQAAQSQAAEAPIYDQSQWVWAEEYGMWYDPEGNWFDRDGNLVPPTPAPVVDQTAGYAPYVPPTPPAPPPPARPAAPPAPPRAAAPPAPPSRPAAPPAPPQQRRVPPPPPR